MSLVILFLWFLWFVIGIVMIVRIWRANSVHGILSLLLPGYIFYAAVRYWGHPDHDIRTLLVLHIVLAAALIWGAQHIEMSMPTVDTSALLRQVQVKPTPSPTPTDAAGAEATKSPSASPEAEPAVAPAAADDAAQTSADPAFKFSATALRDAAASVAFYRGRYERDTIGLQFEIPVGYHLIEGTDARRVQAAMDGNDDAHTVAWLIGLNETLTSPSLRPVRFRWLNDGLVIASPEELDAPGLVRAAQRQTHIQRLAGSGGKLLRFVSPPFQYGDTIVWSEERQPAEGKPSAFDCHGLRLGRKGVLELSIVGVDAGEAGSCAAVLQLLAERVKIRADLDYPAKTNTDQLAMYSLSGLIAQTQ